MQELAQRQNHEIRLKELELRSEQDKKRHESDQMLKSMVTSQMDLMKQMMVMMQGGNFTPPPPPPNV